MNEITEVWFDEFEKLEPPFDADATFQLDMMTVIAKSQYIWPDWNKVLQKVENNV
jgi:hypothetical protein